MSYLGKVISPASASMQVYVFTATASQTVFSGNDNNGLTLSFDSGQAVNVYLNGVLLVAGDDYTTGSNAITLTVGASSGDVLSVAVVNLFQLADVVPASTGGAFLAPISVKGVSYQTYNLAGTDIDPANGTIQHKILSGNATFTESFSDGHSITFMLDTAGFTPTWPAISWVGGVEPSWSASGYNVISLWKVGATLYGNSVGSA